MSKGTKILILILTILPIVLFFGGYIGMFAMMMATAFSETARHAPGAHSIPPPIVPMIIFFVCIGLAGMVSLGMLVFYVINLIVTDKVPRDLKPIWGILFFIAYWVSFLVYWYMYIWGEPSTGPQPTTSIPTPPEHRPNPPAFDL